MLVQMRSPAPETSLAFQSAPRSFGMPEIKMNHQLQNPKSHLQQEILTDRRRLHNPGSILK